MIKNSVKRCAWKEQKATFKRLTATIPFQLFEYLLNKCRYEFTIPNLRYFTFTKPNVLAFAGVLWQTCVCCVLPVSILTHNNLRCIYFNSFDQAMANAFVKHHLLNPDEFWAVMPLPSIAGNDSKFRNIPGNNWSGQPQELTYQRAIRALENYGHFAEATMMGKKVLAAVQKSSRFTQQFDAFSMTANNTSDGYGPTILSVLEFIAGMYGINITKETISWSGLGTASDSTFYEQLYGDKTYSLWTSEGAMEGKINGKLVFSCTNGVRVE